MKQPSWFQQKIKFKAQNLHFRSFLCQNFILIDYIKLLGSKSSENCTERGSRFAGFDVDADASAGNDDISVGVVLMLASPLMPILMLMTMMKWRI
jgi:hypothetical protein